MHSLEGAGRQSDQCASGNYAKMSQPPQGYKQVHGIPCVKYIPWDIHDILILGLREGSCGSEPQREESQHEFEVSRDAKTTVTFL